MHMEHIDTNIQPNAVAVPLEGYERPNCSPFPFGSRTDKDVGTLQALPRLS